jgi:hypothetical protein
MKSKKLQTPKTIRNQERVSKKRGKTLLPILGTLNVDTNKIIDISATIGEREEITNG